MKRIILLSLIFIVSLTAFGQRIKTPVIYSAYTLAPSGVEMLANGELTSGTYWSCDGEWSLVSNHAEHTGGGVYSYLYQAQSDMLVGIASSTNYRLEFDVTSAGTMKLQFSDISNSYTYVAQADYTNGHHIVEFTTPAEIGDTPGFSIRGSVEGDAGSIDNLSLMEI